MRATISRRPIAALRTIAVVAALVAGMVTRAVAQDSSAQRVTDHGEEEALTSDAQKPDGDTGRGSRASQSSSEEKKHKKKKEEKKSKHPTFKIGDDVTVGVNMRLETQLRTATPSIGIDDSSLAWQDRRIGIEGTAYKRFSFELSRELSDDFETTAPGSQKGAWRDAYVSTRFTKSLIVEGGQFKLPFGREALTSEANLDFVYRSLAGRVLSPGRDPGVMSHGRLFDRMLEYQVGYFTRDGENSRTSETQGGEDAIAGRLLVSPFARATEADSWLVPLQVGVAFENSRLDDRLGLRGRTVLGDGVFFDRVYVSGRRQRTGFEAAWARGPASVSTEYITVSDQRKGMGFVGDDLPDVVAASWYVAGTWALTGEHKHGRLEPRHDLLRGGFGAIELAARVEKLRFDTIDYPGSQFGFPTPSKLIGNADRVVTLGVNWYLNDYLKIMTNVIRESIGDPERSPSAAPNGAFTSTVVLFQFHM